MEATASIQFPDPTPIQHEANALVAAAQDIVVYDEPSYATAGEFLRRTKTMAKRIEEYFEPTVKAAHQAHKAAVAARDGILKYPSQAEKIVKDKMGSWSMAERERRERERREAEERARLEAEERQLQEAIALEQAGQKEAAVAVVERPVEVIAPIPEPRAKVAGVSEREIWSAKVLDMLTLVKAVAAGDAPLTLLMVNETTLNSLARSLKSQFRVPGCQVTSRIETAARSF